MNQRHWIARLIRQIIAGLDVPVNDPALMGEMGRAAPQSFLFFLSAGIDAGADRG